MDRTEHFRGRLLSGTETLIDPIEGHLKTHARPPGHNGEWTGFFEVPAEKRETLVDGNRYRLILIDGRSAHVHVHIRENDPLGRTVANFHGNGMCRR